MTALIVLAVITAYLAGIVASAPKLMRLVYQDKLAVIAQQQARYDKELEQWRKRKDRSAFNMPLDYGYRNTKLDAMREARVEGAWWALVWPVSLTYHRLAGTAFKQEIALQHATANAKIIADYDRMLEERFDRELETAGRPPRLPKGGTGVSSPRKRFLWS